MDTVESGKMVKTLKIPDDLHTELSKLGNVGQTYSDVIWMLVNEHKERHSNINKE